MKNNILNVGLIVDQFFVDKYIFDLINWSKNISSIKISTLIVQNKKKRKILDLIIKNSLGDIIKKTFYKLLLFIESALFNFKKKNHTCFSYFNIEKEIDNIIFVNPQISKGGFFYQYSEEDIDKIKQSKLDLLLRCESGILKGEILNVVKFGILSLHHGDNNLYRGSPPGFWEVFNNESSTGFIIQQLTDQLDGGNVIFRGHVPTKEFFLENCHSVKEKSFYYLKNILTEISLKKKLPEFMERKPYSKIIYKQPDTNIILKYFLRLACLYLKDIFYFKILNKKKLSSLYITRGYWKNLAMYKGVKIEKNFYESVFDPFLLEFNNKNYCFVSVNNFRNKKKSVICLYEVSELQTLKLGTILEEDDAFLSFPYVFKYNQKIYFVPNSNITGGTRLYECEEFPYRWRFKKILFKNLNLKNNLIFFYNNLWWLFSNVDVVNNNDYNSELFIFYSKDGPLTENWISHTKNPIFTDCNQAKNSGIIIDDNLIYRVISRREKKNVRQEISINKLTLLDSNNYSEEEYCIIKANFKKNLIGINSFSYQNNVAIFNGIENV
jgi:hypothetical protein